MLNPWVTVVAEWLWLTWESLGKVSAPAWPCLWELELDLELDLEEEGEFDMVPCPESELMSGPNSPGPPGPLCVGSVWTSEFVVSLTGAV